MTKRIKLKSKELGQYYTPSYIVDYIIEQTIGYFLKTDYDKTDTLTILDPACGKGIFLVQALDHLSSHSGQIQKSNESSERIRRTIIANHLYGIDIDPIQITKTLKNLNCLDFNANFKTFNALIPPPSYPINFESYPLEELRSKYKKGYTDGTLTFFGEEGQERITEIEKRIKKTITSKLIKKFQISSNIHPMPWDVIFPETQGKFDIIIGNPPWGAVLFSSDLISSYIVGTQQVDSWSLFIERSLKALKEGGRLGFVIPNTLLLNENYIEIRKFILETCRIIKIVNLGENIFPEITQPCMIIIAEKGSPPTDHKLEVIRHITPKMKRSLKEGYKSLASFPTISCYQKRFLGNEYQFNIFSIGYEEFKRIVEKDLYHNKIQVKPLRDFVENARGVELNRNGKVVQCSSCGWWSSPPNRFNIDGIKWKKCANCQKIVTQNDKTDYIVFNNPQQSERDKPFLVGHHIQRYYIKNHKYIDPARIGINYKDPALYQGPKLLLRKTGRGIRTAIDYKNRWVNQVVYLFKLKKNVSVTLEYIMGVLNSKLMYIFFFIELADPYRQDFPHFTQKKFLRLPIKVPITDNEVTLVNQVSKKAKMLQSQYQSFFSLTQEIKTLKGEKRELNQRILQLEKEVDDLVFKIYGIPPVQKREILSEFLI
ncbi:MAG: Eco57I restriction-modification methylase domain-containing protein [Candidatus Hodarchaeota archaeon]